MKTQKLALLIVVIGLSASVYGQDYTFKVLANKGSNEVKIGGSWQPLKTGASLKKDDEIKLSDNSYIGLVHVSGRPVELKKSGNYKVSELEGQMGTGSSVLHKYTDFILSSNSAEAQKNRLSATGAVHRAVGGEAGIKLMLPEYQHSGIYNTQAVVNWDGSKVSGPYVVTLRNMFEEVLLKTETPETSYKIDLTDPLLAQENAILIEVSSKANPKEASKQYLIKKLSPADRKKVEDAFNEIKDQVSEESALSAYILAGFYEQNGLYIDAITAYEEAVKRAPDVPTFKESYEEFLLRNGLK